MYSEAGTESKSAARYSYSVTERSQRRPERTSPGSGEGVASGGCCISRRAGGSVAVRRLGTFLVVGILINLMAACATSTTDRDTADLPPVSVQSLQYYPFQVKGYQKSFPDKH